MSGFFGFDSALPERRHAPPHQQQSAGFGGFQQTNASETFGMPGSGVEEDLAVYTWGEGGNLLEGGDDLNDETFGGAGPIDNDFQWSSQPAAPPPDATSKKPRGPIASTQSRYGPRVVADPFAASEDDFYASRPVAKKTTSKPAAKPKAQPRPQSVENLWTKPPGTSPMWGAAPSSSTKPSGPSAPASSGPPPPGQIKSLEEIEAEMSRMAIPPAPTSAPSQQRVLTLEEIEQQMLSSAPGEPAAPRVHPVAPPPAPPREATPTQHALAGSGYAAQQALLDSMFPELGAPPPPIDARTAPFPGQPAPPPQPSPEELARMQALHERITNKIHEMAKYNNLMGSSDKDFITRIQLSQLATNDPYTSDFYAQVFLALKRSRLAAEAAASGQVPGEGPQGAAAVVQITPAAGMGVGGPAGNRFGKMGTQTMQKLSTQVKRLVENREKKAMNTAALQGALGRVSRGNTSAPRPVLAVPSATKPEHRPVNALNQQSGPRRQALTHKQVMYALEELYDSVLQLEQMRREMPPPTAMEEIDRWNAACEQRVEGIWRRLMVMEPLDVSNPHPFISLLNPTKGHRLFPRLLRHLPHQQALTLLTLLIACYPQLDVVARAPPPPVADASLLTKADRIDRARREAETDSFLQFVIPGADMLINRCNLGLVGGLLGICAQRMEVWKVASTRPGVALFTALLTRAQGVIRQPAPGPMNPQQMQVADPAEIEQWNKTFAYFLQVLLPHLPELFPSSAAQKAAFGPGAYLIGSGEGEQQGMEMERREFEVWGFVAALAMNAREEDQAGLVGALREKILHTVQSARNPSTPPQRAEMKLRNVNIFLNGLGLDASMIE